MSDPHASSHHARHNHLRNDPSDPARHQDSRPMDRVDNEDHGTAREPLETGPGVAGVTVGLIALAVAAIPYIALFAWVFGLVGFGMGVVGSTLSGHRRFAAYIAVVVSTVAVFVSILATIQYMDGPSR